MAKKNADVAAAEAAVEAAREAIADAEAMLSARRAEHALALQQLTAAKVAADAHLPRCTAVTTSRTGPGSSRDAYVIVRKTPGGILVCRLPGSDAEVRFEFNKYAGEYVERIKRDRWGYRSSRTHLTDVPAEFMPDAGA